MLEVVARNTAARNMEGAFYEMGKEYIPTTPDALPEENKQITIAVYGGDSDFFTIKGMVEELLVKAGVEDAEYTLESGNPTFHPGAAPLLPRTESPLASLGRFIRWSWKITASAAGFILQSSASTACMRHGSRRKNIIRCPSSPPPPGTCPL